MDRQRDRGIEREGRQMGRGQRKWGSRGREKKERQNKSERDKERQSVNIICQ